jgi:hypothetical protein
MTHSRPVLNPVSRTETTIRPLTRAPEFLLAVLDKMKLLTIEEANRYLTTIGMEIGNWNQIVDTSVQNEEICWLNYEAPTRARELLRFSRSVAGWLPKGDWKIVQIDNSSYFDPDRTSLFTGLLFGPEVAPDLSEHRTFLFQFSNSEATNNNTELVIANLVFVLLLLEEHGYVVSSGSTQGQVLGIQDGVVYFCSRDKSISGAEILLRTFERELLKRGKGATKRKAKKSK